MFSGPPKILISVAQSHYYTLTISLYLYSWTSCLILLSTEVMGRCQNTRLLLFLPSVYQTSIVLITSHIVSNPTLSTSTTDLTRVLSLHHNVILLITSQSVVFHKQFTSCTLIPIIQALPLTQPVMTEFKNMTKGKVNKRRKINTML